MNDTASPTPISDETLNLLKVPSTATLTTVLSKMGLWNTFLTGVQPLAPGMRMIGRAFTLRYIPSRADLDSSLNFDNLTDPQRIAIEKIGPGEVLVIDARGDERGGTMGSILAARMQVRGAAGVVTDGAFRDSPVIGKAGMPAYARSAHAATNKTIHHPCDFQVPIGCAGVPVYPGDLLVGDEEGVVVIPPHLAYEVAREAAAQEHREDFITKKIQAGASLVGTYPMDEETKKEYEQTLKENK